MPKPSKKIEDEDSTVRDGFETRAKGKLPVSGRLEKTAVRLKRDAATGKWAKPAKGSFQTTKVRKVGRSSGVILTKDVLAHYKLQDGDEVHVVEEQDGIKLMPYDPAFDEQMEAYRKGARKFRNALRELAK